MYPQTAIAAADATDALAARGRRLIAAPDAAAVAAAAPGVRGLALVWADEEPRVRALGGRLRVGRSLHADVRFEDAATSRRHALICVDADGALVCDEGSLNGVYVNGERVDGERRVTAGDVIVVGLHELRLVELV